MPIDTVVEKEITSNRKESIILIGLGTQQLSCKEISTITGFKIAEIERLKNKHDRWIYNEQDRLSSHYSGSTEIFVSEDAEKKELIKRDNEYWDIYCGFFTGLFEEEVINWFNTYADFKLDKYSKGNN